MLKLPLYKVSPGPLKGSPKPAFFTELPAKFSQGTNHRVGHLERNTVHRHDFLGQSKSKFHTSSLYVPVRRRYSTATNANVLSVKEAGSGSYRISIPLSNNQIVFHLKATDTVSDLLINLRDEDASVSTVGLFAEDGARFAKSSTIADIVSSGRFKLKIDDASFNVQFNGKEPVAINTTSPVGAKSTSSVASTVVPSIVIGGAPINEVSESFDQLKQEFLPLLKQKKELDSKAVRYGDMVLYGGLGLFAAQYCFMARLTWWEFNWDIMEPVTYFVTSGTALLGYVYYVLFKRDYTYTDLHGVVSSKKMLKYYNKHGLDIDKFFSLEYKLNRLDADAARLLEAELELQEQGETAPQEKAQN